MTIQTKAIEQYFHAVQGGSMLSRVYNHVQKGLFSSFYLDIGTFHGSVKFKYFLKFIIKKGN